MATNKKITELTELVEADLADDDVLPIVDISAGETFKVRKSTLASALAGVASLSATTPVAVDQSTGAVTVSIGTVPIASGGTGATTASAARTALGAMEDPMTTRGDIIRRGASATERLALGSSGTVLKSDGTDVAYGNIATSELSGNIDLTSQVTGALPVANGGTNATSASAARTSLGAAASGSNSDITALTGLTTDLAVTHGGTGASTASAARTNLGVAIGSDVQAFDADTAKTDTAQTFTAGQRGEITTLTDGATITPDMADSNNFVVTLGGNRTLANPSNLTAGQSGSFFIVQDGTGSRTLSFGSQYDFAAGTAPTLTTTASAIDRIDYVVRTTSSIHCVATLNYS